MTTTLLIIDLCLSLTVAFLFVRRACKTKPVENLRRVFYVFAVNLFIMAVVDALLLAGVRLPDYIDDMAMILLLVTLLIRVLI